MTDSKYLFVGDHPEVLASGQPIAPGESVPAGALDLDDAHDKRLLDEELFIDTQAARKGQSKEKTR